jgi:GT2 family glycosyltransferase
MVSVTIVTWNSAQYLRKCLESIERQDYQDFEIVILDNASSDETRDILGERQSRCRVIYKQENTGFAAGQNEAIRGARGDFVLCLNPDVVLREDFIRQLLAAAERHPDAGTICGKLLRWDVSREAPSDVLDSTGMYFTRNMRHLDRAADEVDRGQYDRRQYVFGATGAAALFRRQFIEAVSVAGQFFDEEFFAYREDADLAWRAQVMGHKCLYAPAAVAGHVRRVTPERREELPLLINWHSVKNRWLMRAKNATAWLCWRLALPVLWRDVMIFGYALLRDRRMISACLYRWRSDVRARTRQKRDAIQARRRVSDRELLWWFSDIPRAIDAAESCEAPDLREVVNTLHSGEPR